MVKISELHKSIVDRISTKFKDISFNSQRDITEGFDRPSFFIDFSSVENSDFMRNARDLDIPVDIVYFQKTIDNNKIETYKMIDSLNEIFLTNNLIRVNDHMSFEIDEINFDIIDKVLHCYFDINISENYNKVIDKENMEDMEFEINNN